MSPAFQLRASYSLGGLYLGISRVSEPFTLQYEYTQETYSSLGILRSRKFFDAVKPGQLYDLRDTSYSFTQVPNLDIEDHGERSTTAASRTGGQFYCVDPNSSSGKPLLQVMTDPSAYSPPNQPSYLMLWCRSNILPGLVAIPAQVNVWQCVGNYSRQPGHFTKRSPRTNEPTVPYVTALIDSHDWYAGHEAQGMTL